MRSFIEHIEAKCGCYPNYVHHVGRNQIDRATVAVKSYTVVQSVSQIALPNVGQLNSIIFRI